MTLDLTAVIADIQKVISDALVAALAADAQVDAANLAAKDVIIAQLNARIAVLTGTTPPPVDPPPVDPPPVVIPPPVTPPATTGDGSVGAPVGTPQVANLLNGYAHRPPWKVAGVDYAVGVRPGVALKKPTSSNLPAGCDLGNGAVNVNGNNVTLSGYDLSGLTVMISDIATGTVTVIDCAATVVVIRSVANPTPKANLVVRYCTLDGAGQNRDFNMLKLWVPKLTVEYCLIKNGAAGIQCPGTQLIRFNVLTGFAWFTGEHANAIAIQGTSRDTLVSYNTLYGADSRNSQGFPVGIGTGIAFYNDAGGNFFNGTIANNTVIANLPGSGSYLAGFYVDLPGTATGMVVRDNWFASVNGYNNSGSGAFGAIYKNNKGNVTATYTNNRDLNTGQLVSGSV